MILNKRIVKQVLPFLIPFIILLGYLKYSIYYGHFDIKISDYADNLEFLTLFMSDLLKNVFIIILIILFIFLTDSKEKLIAEANRRNDIINEGNFFNRVFLYSKENADIFLIVILSIFVLIFFIFLKKRVLIII